MQFCLSLSEAFLMSHEVLSKRKYYSASFLLFVIIFIFKSKKKIAFCKQLCFIVQNNAGFSVLASISVHFPIINFKDGTKYKILFHLFYKTK